MSFERTFKIAERTFKTYERRFKTYERRFSLGLATISMNGSNKFLMQRISLPLIIN